jgi:hypothetical protein
MKRKNQGVRAVCGALVMNGLIASSNATLAGDLARIAVLERGQYEAKSGEYCDHSVMGAPILNVSGAQLQLSTEWIPARRDVRFGMRYRLEWPQHSGAVPLRMVTRFPLGGFMDEQGKQRTRSEYIVSVQPGIVQYRDYTLGEDFEIVRGVWRFEFWQGNRMIGEQTFCLYDGEHDTGSGCPVPNS